MKETSLDRKIARCQREIEAARKPSMADACAAFIANTSVKLPNGTSTFITEADCRQIKGAARASTAEKVGTTRPLPEAAPPSPYRELRKKQEARKFKVVDRVRSVDSYQTKKGVCQNLRVCGFEGGWVMTKNLDRPTDKPGGWFDTSLEPTPTTDADCRDEGQPI